MQDPQYQSTPTPVADGSSGQPRITANRELIVSVASSAPAVAGTTWTHTEVTLTGASQVVAAANPDRVGLIIQNRTGNNAFAIDLAGGTATLTSGLAIAAGSNLQFTGAIAPANAVTGIGTSAEVVDVWEGEAA